MFKIIGWGLLAAILAPLVLIHLAGVVALALFVLAALAFLDLPSGR